MAITSGFYNSTNNDRTYNADDFNSYLEGLISQNGVFDQVDGGFIVSPGTGGMAVNVATGKAMVQGCWVKSDAVETLAIAAANSLLPRYDMVSLYYNSTNRSVVLRVTTGTAASTPAQPQPVQNTGDYEIALAYVLVEAGATSITAAHIIDTRYNNALCGKIQGLIEQVDISTLYNQYTAAFDALEAQMEQWQAQQQADFESWFNTLTDTLSVNTYIQKQVATVTRSSAGRYVDFPSAITYAAGDALEIFVDGIYKNEGTDYTIQTNEIENIPMLQFTSQQASGAVISFLNIKSRIGNPSS